MLLEGCKNKTGLTERNQTHAIKHEVIKYILSDISILLVACCENLSRLITPKSNLLLVQLTMYSLLLF